MTKNRFFPLVIFLIAANLSACSLPMFPRSNSDDAQLFARGVDDYLARGDLGLLRQLTEQAPQTPWQPRAAAFIALIQTQQQNQQQVEQQEIHGNLLLSEIEERLAQCQEQSVAALKEKTQEMARCQREKTAVSQDLKILEDTLARLKDVLIKTERQAQ